MSRSFSNLWSQDDAQKILKPILEETQHSLQKQYQITLHVDEQAEIFIARAGFNPQHGVRELHRTAEKLVQIPLSKLILEGKLAKSSQWRLAQQDEALEFSIRK
jgi:ATP-dependent Clp protease ATP-binding subunit ClpA